MRPTLRDHPGLNEVSSWSTSKQRQYPPGSQLKVFRISGHVFSEGNSSRFLLTTRVFASLAIVFSALFPVWALTHVQNETPATL